VVLSGPGVDGTVRVQVPLEEADLAAIAGVNADSPRGIDTFVLAAPDQVLAIPRSVAIRTDH
jgi:alpha-D-ribose 1-methylphosphonate 5-triphosphate synthase subunit PhnH